LANRGIRAANVPLVPEMELPPQLLRIPPERIIGLTRSPGSLGEIRSRRMSMMGLSPGESSYVQNDRISREISYASCIMENLGIVVFDVTTRAIEETANEIMALLQNMDQTQS
ncbi:MAG: kinase/pyrophosphorylase, partial [Aminobacteriaceae bacterium]